MFISFYVFKLSALIYLTFNERYIKKFVELNKMVLNHRIIESYNSVKSWRIPVDNLSLNN